MIKRGVKWWIIAGLAAGFAAAVQAEDFDIGKWEYQSSCASCHGADGKGKGPASGQLKVPPPDLTMLSKTNNGVFPTEAVHQTISGLQRMTAHGSHEMPIWGFRFNPLVSLPKDVDPAYWKLLGPEQSPDVVVRTRILAIIDYLNRIQQK
jgi:hypothetical protein